MSEPKVMAADYIDFLIASPAHVTATEAAKVQPDYPDPPAHDAFTRALTDLVFRLQARPHTPIRVA